jgi:hypothetical protein
MSLQLIVLLCASALNANDAIPKDLITSGRTSCIWTGKELLIWDGGKQAAAFDPERNAWRAVDARVPDRRIAPQGFFRFSDGSILAAYWSISRNSQLCFDRCWPELNRWKRIATIDCKEFKDPDAKPYEPFFSVDDRTWFVLDVLGMAALGDGAVVLVNSNCGDPVMGVAVDRDGRTRWISRVGAPRTSSSAEDTAVYSFGDKVLCYSYARVDCNIWSVWDSKTDTWSKPEECARRYDFSQCQIGDEVYIYGGAESSAFGWIKKDGAVYSFSKNAWRPLPMKERPAGRRGGVLCAAGDRVFVLGGSSVDLSEERLVVQSDSLSLLDADGKPIVPPPKAEMGKDGADSEPARRGTSSRVVSSQQLKEVPRDPKDSAALANTGLMAFDPVKQAWQTIPSLQMPDSRYQSLAIWTGKEMIVWGGCADMGQGSYGKDGYAFNPKTGLWRKLPDMAIEISR